MDKPDASWRQHESDSPVLIPLTDDERLRALDLFAGESLQAKPPRKDESQLYERVPAYVGPVIPLDVRAAPAVPPETWRSPVWQAPRWAAVLTATVVICAATTVFLMRPTPGGQIAPAPVAVVPSNVTLPPIDPPTVVPAAAVSGERASLPAPALSTPPLSPERQAPRVRRDAPIQLASVSNPATTEPLPISESTIAPLLGSPVLPASLPVDSRPVAALAPTLPRAELSAVPVPRVPAPETAIQTVLSQYRTAYRELDAGAALAIWPSVDTKALRRAFDQLEQQDLIFDSCQIAVTDARAVASCRGFASYVPRVGNKGVHDDQRQWEFKLSKVAEVWQIDTVSAR